MATVQAAMTVSAASSSLLQGPSTARLFPQESSPGHSQAQAPAHCFLPAPAQGAPELHMSLMATPRWVWRQGYTSGEEKEEERWELTATLPKLEPERGGRAHNSFQPLLTQLRRQKELHLTQELISWSVFN